MHMLEALHDIDFTCLKRPKTSQTSIYMQGSDLFDRVMIAEYVKNANYTSCAWELIML